MSQVIITFRIEVDNDVFIEGAQGLEMRRIIEHVAETTIPAIGWKGDPPAKGFTFGLFDLNGNTVGTASIEGRPLNDTEAVHP